MSKCVFRGFEGVSIEKFLITDRWTFYESSVSNIKKDEIFIDKMTQDILSRNFDWNKSYLNF